MKLTVFFLIIIAQIGLSQSLTTGLKFMEYNKYNSALAAFSKVFENQPSDSVAYYWIGQAYIKNNELEKAKNHYQNSPFKKAKIMTYGLLQTQALLKINVKPELLQLSKSPKTTAHEIEHVALSRALIDAKMYSEADLFLKNVLANYPKNIHYLEMLSKNAVKNQKGNEAYKYLLKAASLDSNNASVQYQLGKLFVSSKNPEAYLPYFKKTLAIDSLFVPAWYEMFRHSFFFDKPQIKKYYTKYLELTDKNETQEYQLLVNNYALKKYSEVIKSGEKILADKENLPSNLLYRYMAYSYFVKKDNQKAYENMLQYVTVKDSADITQNDKYLLAQFASRLSVIDSTAIGYIKAQFLEDSIVKNKQFYGQTLAYHYSKNNDLLQTNIWRQNMLELNNYPHMDMYKVGVAWYQLKNDEKAETIFKKFMELYPQEHKGIYMLAGINSRKDSTMALGLAVPFFNEFVEKAGENTTKEYKPMLAQSYNYLGTYYMANKDYDQAIVNFNKLKILKPNDLTVNKIIKDLKKYQLAVKSYEKKVKERDKILSNN